MIKYKAVFIMLKVVTFNWYNVQGSVKKLWAMRIQIIILILNECDFGSIKLILCDPEIVNRIWVRQIN